LGKQGICLDCPLKQFQVACLILEKLENNLKLHFQGKIIENHQILVKVRMIIFKLRSLISEEIFVVVVFLSQKWSNFLGPK